MKWQTLKECMEDYINRSSPDYEGRSNRIKRVEVGTKVSAKTVRDWLSGRSSPTGDNAIWLICFFELLGYNVRETQHLTEQAHNLFRLVGFGMITVDDLAAMLNFSTDHTRKVLRGTKPIAETQAQNVDSILELHNNLLDPVLKTIQEVKRKKEREDALIPLSEEVVKKPDSEEQDKEEQLHIASGAGTGECVQKEKFLLLQALAGLCSTALPLAECVASDGFTSEDRIWLRKKVGEMGIYNLSNLLTRISLQLDQLCGERARAQARKKQ